MLHFQDDNFVVSEIAGDTVEELIGFVSETESQPEKLLIRLSKSGWWDCYLSAFIGHWHPLDDLAVTEVTADYEDFRVVDYAHRFGFAGSRLRHVMCRRDDGGTTITIAMDAGVLELSEMDPADPHSDSVLRWRA